MEQESDTEYEEFTGSSLPYPGVVALVPASGEHLTEGAVHTYLSQQHAVARDYDLARVIVAELVEVVARVASAGRTVTGAVASRRGHCADVKIRGSYPRSRPSELAAGTRFDEAFCNREAYEPPAYLVRVDLGLDEPEFETDPRWEWEL